jgi:hypothetical protein
VDAGAAGAVEVLSEDEDDNGAAAVSSEHVVHEEDSRGSGSEDEYHES